MPTEVKNRVRCLKNIQVDLLKLESQFYQEVQKLEAKFYALVWIILPSAFSTLEVQEWKNLVLFLLNVKSVA